MFLTIAQYIKKADKKEIHTNVIEFLKKNPNPKDSELHDWAKEKKYDIPQVETEIYKLATTFVKFLTGGKANEKGIKIQDVDPDELAMGIKVESEHIDDLDVQRRIALDHLAESKEWKNTKYYTGLKGFEKKMSGESN